MKETHDKDAQQLKDLGYTSHFERSMSLWENFALGFTYLSPVVGVYSVFAMALKAGGAPMFWNYIFVGIGQLLVCLVFGEIVSQYPIAGGLYPWSLRLVGRRWAWMSAWVYGWALFVTIAAVAVGGAPFLSQLLGMPMSPATSTSVAVTMIALVTLLNVSGTKLLARVAMFGFICELVGAILVGGYLLLFARHQPLSVVFDTGSFGQGWNYLPALLASSLAAMFCYYGFEACGDLAEETPNASVAIPKSMRMTIYVGGGAATLVCLALLLALPDLGAAISGIDPDPVGTTLKAAMGDTGFRLVIAVVMVSFLSCLLSLQAAASRLLYSFARDKMIFGSRLLSQMSPTTKVPVNALLATGLIPAVIAVMGLWLQDAVNTIISFAAIGIYVAFQMVVLAALSARMRGWKPSGAFTLGRWGWAVNITALAYGIGAVINMLWPRAPDAPWFVNYGMLVTTVIAIAGGLLYMFLGKPHHSVKYTASNFRGAKTVGIVVLILCAATGWTMKPGIPVVTPNLEQVNEIMEGVRAQGKEIHKGIFVGSLKSPYIDSLVWDGKPALTRITVKVKPEYVNIFVNQGKMKWARANLYFEDGLVMAKKWWISGSVRNAWKLIDRSIVVDRAITQCLREFHKVWRLI